MRPPLIVCVLLLVACTGVPPTDDGRLAVAVSVAPQAWLVERIGGEAVRVTVAVPPGASPHGHLPSDHEIAALRASAVYFRTGVPFERGTWFKALSSTGGPQVVDLRRGLIEIDDHDHDHDHDHGGHHHHHDHGVDPHIWLDPTLLRAQVSGIRDVLSALRPTEAAGFAARAAALDAELTALDTELRARLGPYRDRAFAVYHPAWTRFAAAYGLRQLAVETAGQEPSDAELTALQRALGTNGVTTLFVQPQIHGRSAGRLAAALDLELRTLDPLANDPVANLRAVATELIASWSGLSAADDAAAPAR